MANITLKNVYKTYDKIYTGTGKDIIAVRDFNLEIKDREVIVLVGPSGCGKTSTLRMIAGLEEITKGELYIDGRLVNEVHPKDRGIAMTFQNYALFPHMTVFENIAFGLEPDDLPEAEIKSKAEEAAGIFKIAHILKSRPHQLSGGQKQRVALARAMVRENKVVLLDEPFSNLDAALSVSMRLEMIKLHKKFNTTLIYVTHAQHVAMSVADRIVVMRDGMIQQVGTPEELYLRPANLFVAGFLGSPQMNFWNTEIGGRAVIKGVRPEDMYIDPAGEIDAIVEVREFLGERTYLYCKDGDHAFTVRVPLDCKARSGDKIKIAVNPDKIYLFDKETETAIMD
jgi:multiple sugar transport system ATP-binding protein